MNTENEIYNRKRKKYKIYKRKKFIATILATATLVGMGYTFHIRKNNDKINANPEYVVGYEDIGLLNQITNRVTNNNFILLDIGDHNSRGVFFQKQKLDYCLENGIDLGLIVSSNSSTLSDIYLDLEYTMIILENYNINYPVYLNIDGILNRENLTLIEAKNLISAFLEKAIQNNIYIGICGSQENMLDEYLIYDHFTLDTTSKEGIIFKENNIYYANLNLKEKIQTNLYNQPNCFKQDEYHLCKEGESLKSIANLYNISVNDLRKYNNIISEKNNVGSILRIPSMVQNGNHHLEQEVVKKGIDVSLWQDTINWEEVDVDFAIIQIRDFINQENDPQFQNNVNGCLENGIPMGFYVFSRATTVDEIREEAKYAVSQLKGIPTEYPIYLDVETEFWDSIDGNGKLLIENLDQEQTKKFVIDGIQTWEREIMMAGYTPGIYCNQSLYTRLNKVTNGYLENLSCWVAGGSYYDQEVIYEESLPIYLGEEEKIAIKQISGMGKVNGISNYVDLNYCYMDYDINYTWERKKFLKLGSKLKTGIPIMITGGFLLKIGIHRRKKKRKIKKLV